MPDNNNNPLLSANDDDHPYKWYAPSDDAEPYVWRSVERPTGLPDFSNIGKVVTLKEAIANGYIPQYKLQNLELNPNSMKDGDTDKQPPKFEIAPTPLDWGVGKPPHINMLNIPPIDSGRLMIVVNGERPTNDVLDSQKYGRYPRPAAIPVRLSDAATSAEAAIQYETARGLSYEDLSYMGFQTLLSVYKEMYPEISLADPAVLFQSETAIANSASSNDSLKQTFMKIAQITIAHLPDSARIAFDSFLPRINDYGVRKGLNAILPPVNIRELSAELREKTSDEKKLKLTFVDAVISRVTDDMIAEITQATGYTKEIESGRADVRIFEKPKDPTV